MRACLAFGNSQCVSIYSRNGSLNVNYEAVSGSAVFQYGVGVAASPAAACAAFVPGISGAALVAPVSAVAVLAAAILAALSLLL